MQLVKALLASLLMLAECGYLHAYGVPGKAAPPPPPPPPPVAPIIHQEKPTQLYQAPVTTCAGGQVLHVDGRCVTPAISRSVYLFNVPQQASKPAGPPPPAPLPRVDHNVIFVRVPEDQRGPDPIVVPPPQQKNIVYVLKKNTELSGPKVIEAPSPPKTNPDVYFVGYDQGENPILPTGEDLASVLAQGGHETQAKVVDSGPSGGQAGSSSTGAAAGPVKEVASQVGSLLPPLPVAGFGTQGGPGSGGALQGSTDGAASVGAGTINKGSSIGGAGASTSAPVTQKTQVAPFSYYIEPYSKP